MERIAFGVEIRDETAIVFAENKNKAKWIAVRGYWEAFEKREWLFNKGLERTKI